MTEKITTTELAELFGVKTQTVRRSVWLTGAYMGLTPVKLPNRALRWDAIEARSILFTGTKNLQGYQLRVIDEKAELDAKLDKLAAFWRSDAWLAVPPDEQDRMKRQAEAMAIYSSILKERIEAFK